MQTRSGTLENLRHRKRSHVASSILPAKHKSSGDDIMMVMLTRMIMVTMMTVMTMIMRMMVVEVVRMKIMCQNGYHKDLQWRKHNFGIHIIQFSHQEE